MEKNQIVYGLRPVMEAVKAGKQINKIYFQSNLQGKLFSELKALIKQSGKNIQQQYVPLEKLDYLSRKQNHQGVVAVVPPFNYCEIEDILDLAKERGDLPESLSKQKEMFLDIIGAKSNDITRENANMNADTPAGMMMKFASETTKPFVDDFLLSKEVREAVNLGYIHIHDKDYYPTKSLTCLQHPLDKILENAEGRM